MKLRQDENLKSVTSLYNNTFTKPNRSSTHPWTTSPRASLLRPLARHATTSAPPSPVGTFKQSPAFFLQLLRRIEHVWIPDQLFFSLGAAWLPGDVWGNLGLFKHKWGFLGTARISEDIWGSLGIPGGFWGLLWGGYSSPPSTSLSGNSCPSRSRSTRRCCIS